MEGIDYIDLTESSVEQVGKKSRRWCWTLNNWTLQEASKIETLVDLKLASYVVYSEEVGESGTKHLQGYLECKIPSRLSHVRQFPGLSRAHFEIAKGSFKDNFLYIVSGNDNWWHFY